MEKGEGWIKVVEGLGYIYWIKIIYDDEVLIKIVYMVDMLFFVKVFL